MSRVLALLGALFVSSVASRGEAANAKPGVKESTAKAKPAESPETNLGHHGQLDLRAELVAGYRMLFRYNTSPRCALYDYAKPSADQQKFCGFGGAPALGIALGYAAVDYFEPFVFARFGLANEADRTNQGKALQLGAGARLYTMSDSPFKIFFAPFLGVDLTQGPAEPIGTGLAGSPGRDDASAGVKTTSFRTDLLAHLDIGPEYDFSRTFGVYLSGGLTFQMLRYLGASAEVTVGLQARAP
jgi:hypothetical protein